MRDGDAADEGGVVLADQEHGRALPTIRGIRATGCVAPAIHLRFEVCHYWQSDWMPGSSPGMTLATGKDDMMRVRHIRHPARRCRLLMLHRLGPRPEPARPASSRHRKTSPASISTTTSRTRSAATSDAMETKPRRPRRLRPRIRRAPSR